MPLFGIFKQEPLFWCMFLYVYRVCVSVHMQQVVWQKVVVQSVHSLEHGSTWLKAVMFWQDWITRLNYLLEIFLEDFSTCFPFHFCDYSTVKVPRREAGDVWCYPPVWNLRAVIWFFCLCHFSAHGPVSCLFFQKTLKYFSLMVKLFCMALVEQLVGRWYVQLAAIWHWYLPLCIFFFLNFVLYLSSPLFLFFI